MAESAQIVHQNGHKDPVAIIGTKLLVGLFSTFVIVTLAAVGGVWVLNWRVGSIENRLDVLGRKIEMGMDSRWRRTDQDAYATEIDRRLRALEQRPFPFTETKSEQLTRLMVDVERLQEQVAECVRRWEQHDGRHHEDGK